MKLPGFTTPSLLPGVSRRYLLAHSEFQNLRGGALAQALRCLTNLDEESLNVILSEIERVRYAKGAGPLEWAAAMACQYPLSRPGRLADRPV